MAKYVPDKDGELKRLAEEFQKIKNAEELRERNEDAGAKAEEQQARAAGALPKPMVIGTIAAVVIIAALLLAWKFLGSSKANVGLVAVPNVINQDAVVAKSMVMAAGFRARISYDATSRVLPGRVVKQVPSANTKITAGGDVIITVAGSSPNGPMPRHGAPRFRPRGMGADRPTSPPPTPGPTTPAQTSKVAVPDIEGVVDSKAKRQLEALGLKVVETLVMDTTQPAHVVITSDPKPFTQLDAGATVHLTISAGAATASDAAPVAEKVLLGSYAGQPGRAAVEDLQNKGLVATWRTEPSRQVTSGYVIRTEPGASTALAKGSKVTVVIAR